uniref:Cholesterol 7-alpha-monooxygenase-like n=1 Tax=Phallusia mammillata TaxID=59560 RepID=A0A6F9DB35_9ASCI|nr:cholesterol 7-alpha-monooxygenase-like [Phallusia mammillata]
MLEYALTVLLLLINFVVLNCLLRQRRRKRTEPPLIHHYLPFIGSALDFGKDPLNYLMNLKEKYGDVYTIELAGWNAHVFANPLDVRNLERTKALDHKDIIGDFVTCMVGKNHYIHNNPDNTGPSFLERLMGRAHSVEQIEPTPAKISKSIEHALDSNLRGSMQLSDLCHIAKDSVVIALRKLLQDVGVHKGTRKVHLYDMCKRIIFDITFNLFFGSLPDPVKRAEETARFYDVFKIYFAGSPLMVDRIPVHLLPATKRALAKILEMIGEINWSERNNVSQLITDIVDSNPHIDFKDARARHLMIILWSAQANTAPALFWTLAHLLKNPDAKRAVLKEFEEFNGRYRLRGRSSAEPTADASWPQMNNILSLKKKDIDKLVVLDGCLKETMRLTGSSMSVRKAMQDTVINTSSGRQYAIRKGDYTIFFAPVTHMDHEIFESPKEYDYDRFLIGEHEGVLSSCVPSSSCDSDSQNSEPTQLLGTLRSRSRFYKAGQRIAASRSIMTFGFGSTRCPGRHIAMIEIKLVTLALLKHFDVKICEPDKPLPDFDLTHLGFGVMPPSQDVRVRIALPDDHNNNMRQAF